MNQYLCPNGHYFTSSNYENSTQELFQCPYCKQEPEWVNIIRDNDFENNGIILLKDLIRIDPNADSDIISHCPPQYKIPTKEETRKLRKFFNRDTLTYE